MNKQTKAAIAAGAGAILLLGGAGSLAFWGDESDVLDSDINSGQLSLGECADGGTWTDTTEPSPAVPVPITDIEAFLMVPGDRVSYTCTTTLTATGDNLAAELSATIGAATGDAELLAALGTPEVTVELDGVDLPTGTVVAIAPQTGGSVDIVVEVEIEFDPTTTGTIGQNQTVNLANTELKLDQLPNPAP